MIMIRVRRIRAWCQFQLSGTMFLWPQRFMRAMVAAFPKWLLWLWMFLRFIPTPFEIDEWLPAIFALALLLWPAISHDGWKPLFNWHRLGRYRSAWRGSKSHRSWDERRALRCGVDIVAGICGKESRFLLVWEAWDISIDTRVHARRIVMRTCPRHWLSPLFNDR